MQAAAYSVAKEHVAPAARARTDGEMLACFLNDRDNASFEMLIARYATMISAVCRYVLHHRQDVEDASQHTFFLLAQKAGSLHAKQDVGRWLRAAAYHVAQNVKTRKKRRENHERRCPSCLPAQPLAEAIGHEEQDNISEAILSLPVRLFIPFVLHYEEGKSRVWIARCLEVPEGTVANHLKKARQLVKQELRRRGIIP